MLSFLTHLFVLAADAPSAVPGQGQPQGPAPGPGDGMLQMLLMIGPMVVIFWLLIWRPESKRRKSHETLMNSLKPKDKVVTVGGMHGTVVDLDKDDVVLLVDAKKDIKIKFRRSSISSIESAPAEAEKK